MRCPIVNLTKKLISIPSISPFDLGCQSIIIDKLSKIGFNIVLLNYNNTKNIWAYRGKGVTLSFAGHTDVVPIGNKILWKTSPFLPTIKNGYLFGRGAADMKGSLAAMIVAAERFISVYPNYSGKLSFLITSDEESDAIDGTIRIVEYLKSIQQNIDYCVIGEPTSDKFFGDTIKIGRRGSLHANIVIYGLQGHIAYPELTDNPIHNSLSFLKLLVSKKWSDGNKKFSSTSIQISNLFSGTGSENIVPGELNMKCNFRFGDDISEKEIKKKFENLLQIYNLKYKIVWKLSGKPFLTKSDKLIKLAIDAIQKFININPILSTSGGTSDGRFIKNIASELIELGPRNHTMHKVNECVKIKDLQLLSLIYEDIMKKILL